jgi:hypothetical protein
MAFKITLAKEGKPVGSVIIYHAPLQHDHDYICSPPGALTFDQVKQMAAALAKGRDAGQFDGYKWWESG